MAMLQSKGKILKYQITLTPRRCYSDTLLLWLLSFSLKAFFMHYHSMFLKFSDTQRKGFFNLTSFSLCSRRI